MREVARRAIERSGFLEQKTGYNVKSLILLGLGAGPPREKMPNTKETSGASVQPLIISQSRYDARVRIKSNY